MVDYLFSDRARDLADSSLKEVLETYPGVISFAGGLPDERAFDHETIQEIAREVASDLSAWQYLPTGGALTLRQAIAEHVSSLGIEADVENVLVTSGSQQGLDLLAKAFVDPGDRVLIEAPGYLGARKAFEIYQASLVPIPLRSDGLHLDALQETPGGKLLYTVSTFQNPAGYTLSESKRRRLLEIAAEKDFLIVEDGAYHELRYDGNPVSPIKSMDRDGRVIHLGSFSKTLVPGVRIGWIVASKEIIDKLALIKQSTDLATNSFGQLFVLRWLKRVGLRPPIDLYRKKRDRSLEALAAWMPDGTHWNRAEGGFFLWVRLPEPLDAAALLPRARANGVSFVPGYAFGGEANAFRFSFSQVALQEIDPGVQRLAKTVREAQHGTE